MKAPTLTSVFAMVHLPIVLAPGTPTLRSELAARLPEVAR
jgi:hypothetical protein